MSSTTVITKSFSYISHHSNPFNPLSLIHSISYVEMFGDSSRKRDKRSIPFEDIEGEEAFNIAVRQVAPKKATPKRGRGAGSISGGRGSLTGQHVEDNGGQEGKTIPIEVNVPVSLGEIDSSYLVHYPLFPKKRPSTKQFLAAGIPEL
jgi:hypothetical protein